MNAEFRLDEGVHDWINESGSRVSHRIFTDPAIHALEIERIFNRSWIFLGHESEIPKPADYVTRPMGSDNVIVSRGEDLKIRAFLNVCRHRGVQICRADSGTARRFVCPYHTWTYDTTGALRSTSYDQYYDKAKFAQLGLTPVPQLAVYHGLIFGNWDAGACSLDEHLGDLKWYLDVLFGRTPGGISVIAPPQRWVIETNWKIPALNFLDAQHALRTHIGPVTMAQQALGARSMGDVQTLQDETTQVTFPQGHGILMAPHLPNVPPFYNHAPELVALYKQTLGAEQLALLRDAPPVVGTIFPNTSWLQPLSTVEPGKPVRIAFSWRNWQPRGPNKVEVWSWNFAATEASADLRAEMYTSSLQAFGVSGTYEQDDGEAWAAISRCIQGSIASRGFMDFSSGCSEPPIQEFRFPGIAYPKLLEQSQRGFLARWKRQMGMASSGDGTGVKGQ